MKRAQLLFRRNKLAVIIGIAIFATVGTASLLLSSATGLTIDTTLPVPKNVKAYGDDRNIIVAWDGQGSGADTRVVGYYISYRLKGSSEPYKIRQQQVRKDFRYNVEYSSSIQLQPLANGSEYEINVQTASGSMRSIPHGTLLGSSGGTNSSFAFADGKVSNKITVYATPSSARVDEMRNRLTGFFDDFNQPAGPFDEKKWNTATTACVAPNTAAAFLNDQYHSHNQIRSTCDRSGMVSRPRAVFDISGATETNPAIIQFDIDGASQSRDTWYLDIIPLSARTNNKPLDITSHNDLFDMDGENPGNMVRINARRDTTSYAYYNSSQSPSGLSSTDDSGMPATAPLGPLETPNINRLPHPNVRNQWIVEITPTRMRVTVNGKVTTVRNLPTEFTSQNEFTVHSTMFSYNTGKDYVQVKPYVQLIHWDNFGFTGPAQKEVIHNYLEGGQTGTTPGFSRYHGTNGSIPQGNRTTIIPVPDDIGNLVDDKGWLYLTFQNFTSSNWTWRPENHVLFNGVKYDIPDPKVLINNPKPINYCTQYVGPYTPFAFAIPINKSDIKKGGNVVSFNVPSAGNNCNGTNPGVFNVHLELPYSASDSSLPYYSRPLEVFGQSYSSLVRPPFTVCDQYWFVERDLGLPYESGKTNLDKENGCNTIIDGHITAGTTDPNPLLCQDPVALNHLEPIPCSYAVSTPPPPPPPPPNPATVPLAEVEADNTLATWTDVVVGSNRQPTINIIESVYPDSKGVQFLYNGDVDERSSARPGGYDATGPLDNSLFHMYPAITLSDGDTLDARWTDKSGTVRRTVYTVGQSTADTTNPTISITAPTSNETVSGTVTISATASDNVGVTRVSYYLNDSSTAFSNDSSEPYTSTWNSANVPNGSHTIKATAIDAAGNVGTSSIITINVQNIIIDTIAPSTLITAPANNDTINYNIVVAVDATDNVGVTKVELVIDGIVAATDTSSPYSFNLDTTILSEGVHELRSRAYDAAGNNTYSDIVAVTVDNIPPVLLVCEDTAANNLGRELPCTYDPTPEEPEEPPTPTTPGDANGDNLVNRDDLRIVKYYYKQSVPAYTNGDLDGNGFVDRNDYRIVLYYYSKK